MATIDEVDALISQIVASAGHNSGANYERGWRSQWPQRKRFKFQRAAMGGSGRDEANHGGGVPPAPGSLGFVTCL